MSEIHVAGSAAIQQIIDSLTNLNREFRVKADEIRQEQNALTTKWAGDASTAFQETFRRQEPNFEAFATAIDEYVKALQEILAEYERAEETNKTIASE